MLDKKTFMIGVLCVTGALLLVANVMVPEPAMAAVAVKDRDYTAVTGRTTKGGDALFLTDNRTGMMAVFVFDPNGRTLRALDVKPVTEAFAGRAAAGGADERMDRPAARNPRGAAAGNNR
jgi:hypothetical protein